MNGPSTWQGRIAMARWLAVGAALSAFGYLGLSAVLPWWFVAVAAISLACAHWHWLSRLRTLPLVGSLTRREKSFQAAVLAGAACLGTAGLVQHFNVVATLTVSVAVIANASACRRKDIAVATIASVGACLLVLGSNPTLIGLPVLVLAWALALATLVVVASMGLIEGPSEGVAVHVFPTRPRGPWAQAAKPLAFSTLVALLVLLLDPTGTGGGDSGGARSLLNPSNGNQRNKTYNGPMDLNARGPLGNAPLANVSAASPSHWRTAILSDYDGTRFIPTSGGDNRVGETRDGVAVTALMSNGAPASGRGTSFDVRPYHADVPVMAPGHLQTIGLPLDGLRLLPGSTLLTNSAAPYSLTASLTPDAADVIPAQGGSSRGDARWTGLPTTVGPRTRELAVRITATATTVPDRVQAIESYLRTNYRYNLEAPRAPAGRDAVEYFLFDSKEGFCEHFAASEVVLLRSLGIPARVATGFLGGETDPKDPNRRIVLERNAHAWTEVYIVGHGWLPSDSTPSSGSAGGSSLSDRVKQEYQKVMKDQDLRILLAMTLIGLALAAWLITSLVVVWRRRRGPGDTVERTDLQKAADRLLLALARSDRASAPDETLREMSTRVAPAAAGLGVVEQSLYSPHPVTPEQSASAVAVLTREASRLERESGSGRWRVTKRRR